MLQLRPNCELCDCDLPATADNARICTYECTFCADCVDTVLHNVCPNCGGGFVSRPIRPATPWRDGVSRTHQVPNIQRRALKHDRENIAALVARIKDIAPADR